MNLDERYKETENYLNKIWSLWADQPMEQIKDKEELLILKIILLIANEYCDPMGLSENNSEEE